LKKITIFVDDLYYGVVEQSVVALANALLNNYNVSILAVYNYDMNLENKLDPRIELKYIFKNVRPYKENFKSRIKYIFSNLTKKSKIVRAIEGITSDIIITTKSYQSKLVKQNLIKDVLKIAFELDNSDNKKYIDEVVNSTNGFDYLVLISNSAYNTYHKLMGEETKCIYIPLIMNSIPEKMSELTEENIISIGKLSKEKGYSDLLLVFKRVLEKYPNWKLNIIGDGEERGALEKKCSDLKIENNVIFHGYLSTIERDKILEESSIYVMSSLKEPYGLVLLEAFSFGMPCIAFNSAKGALDIIEDNENGFIIARRNREEMASKIVFLIKNKDKRIEFGRKGRRKIMEHREDKVLKSWIEIIEKGMKKKK